MYVTELFSKEFLNEVAMNPTEYKKSLKIGVTEKVLIGFEFEVCVPKASIVQASGTNAGAGLTMQTLIDRAGTNWWHNVSLHFGSYRFIAKAGNGLGISEPITIKGRQYRTLRTAINKYVTLMYAAGIEKTLAKITPARQRYIKSRFSSSTSAAALQANYRTLKAYIYNNLDSLPDGRTLYKFICKYDPTRHNNNDIPNGIRAFIKTAFDSVDPAVVLPKLVTNLAKAYRFFNNGVDYGARGNGGNYSQYDYNGAVKVLSPPLQQHGYKVNIFRQYHERSKNKTDWYIEPDGSLKPKPGDGAAEVVSPPMPANKAIDALKSFYDMGQKLNLYTGKEHKTGLHINISIPKTLDILKLALFLDDHYVLKKFDRLNNDYAQSLLASMTERLHTRYHQSRLPVRPKKLADFAMLSKLAKDISDDHFASINWTGKYISFRHAGGDYLGDYESIYNIVGRFVRAMIIASDPNMYKNEYIAKLSKFVKPVQNDNEKMNLMKINELKNQPIGVVCHAMCPIGTPPVTEQELTRQEGRSDGILVKDPELIRRLVQNSGTQLRTETKEKILNNINSSIIQVEYCKDLERLQRFAALSANGIYGAASKIGVVLHKSETVLPGTPIHSHVIRHLIHLYRQQFSSNR